MDADTPPVAHIQRTDSAAGSQFVAMARSAEGFRGDFRLLFTRKGPNGGTTTRQAGRVDLPPGGDQSLTTVRVGPLSPQDDWQATLELLEDGVVVATRTLSGPDGPAGR